MYISDKNIQTTGHGNKYDILKLSFLKELKYEYSTQV
jgi:hypothetical protein